MAGGAFAAATRGAVAEAGAVVEAGAAGIAGSGKPIKKSYSTKIMI